MLQAHSWLWHYLWLAPHILEVFLAYFIWRRGLHKRFPIFFAYLLFESIEEFILYTLDVLPSVSASTFWWAFIIGLTTEAILKVAVVAELFSHLLHSQPALVKLGRNLMSGAGASFILMATLAAAYAPMDHPKYILIYRAHILLQSIYVIECGLVLFVFLFAGHFRLVWNRQTFGIALGLGILSCEHMGAWAVMASGTWIDSRHLIDFLNMATYHFCVLIWFYFLLVPQKSPITSPVSLPENNLAIWNRELERLLQQ